MAFSAERITELANSFGFDSSLNFKMFTIEPATDSDIDTAIIKPTAPNFPNAVSRKVGDFYECIVFWDDSAGEITLGSHVTEVTE